VPHGIGLEQPVSHRYRPAGFHYRIACPGRRDRSRGSWLTLARIGRTLTRQPVA
jgi:hypothetical protein